MNAVTRRARDAAKRRLQRKKPERRFRKVMAEGEVVLGTCHELEQVPRTPSKDELIRAHIQGATGRLDALSPTEHGLGEVLDYRLSVRSKDTLQIAGSGLVTSYGLFGAPGSGKTVLMLRMLDQVLGLGAGKPDRRYGALILDPKAALISDIAKIAKRHGRSADHIVVNTEALRRGPGINPIDCAIDPQELGSLLVLAGRSAGVDARDPFWFQEWVNLFSASLGILRAHAVLHSTARGPRPITLSKLVGAIMDEEGTPPRRRIQQVADEVMGRREKLPREIAADVPLDAQALDRFFRQTYIGTIEAFISKAFGAFRRQRLSCYSPEDGRGSQPGGQRFYEDIIENGRIVHVAVSPSEPALAKTLCTLIKCLFQRTVLLRGDLFARGVLSNDVRPLLLACDEYSEIASEVPGQSMGDGQFLALAREFGCMALLATQSVHVLEASSLGEAWRSVFSNFAAKIYMRAADPETAEAASQLAGENDWRIVSRSSTLGAGGGSAGTSRELRERPNLPTAVLTQVLKRGEAVVIGSLDGGTTLPGVHFLKVPPPSGVSS